MNEKDIRDGNPLKITKNQHIYPRALIKNFCYKKENAWIYNKIFNKKYSENINKVFVAKRCWNERAEKGFMKTIEYDFHAIMPVIVSSALNLKLLPSDLEEYNQIITKYFLLLLLRYKFSRTDYINVIDPNITNEGAILKNVHGDKLTQEQKENLESKGVLWVEPHGTNTGVINKASCIGLLIQMMFDYRMKNGWENIEWQVFRTYKKLIFPDNFADTLVFPIHPYVICWGIDPLIKSRKKILFLKDNEAASVNLDLISQTEKYYLVSG